MNRKTSLERNASTRTRDNKLVDRKPLAEVKAINKASKDLIKIDNSQRDEINNKGSIIITHIDGDRIGNTINIVAKDASIINVYRADVTAFENEIRLLKELLKSKDEIIEMLKKNVSIKVESA